MKSIEEKAKRYDEVLEKARQLCAYPTTKPFISDLQDLFPELAESEDKRIRKWLIALIKSNEYGRISNVGEMPCPKRNVIAWLEKQGEQHTDEEMKELLRTEYEKGRADAIEEMQKPAWSEEDEIALGDALWCCKQAASIAKDENDMGNIWYAENWLKSLKERIIPQPKQEWSEEDETKIKSIIAFLKSPSLCAMDGNKGIIDENIKWFKSLKERYAWKPSDEQMKVLEIAIRRGIKLGTWEEEALKSLKEQLFKLKKLRKE